MWLFADGVIAGYHPMPQAPSAADGWSAVRTYLVDRIKLKSIATDDGRAWTRSTPEPEAPKAPRRPSGDDPYELLEVESTATDAEVRSAFLTALKLNHPDKVAHMSRAIQDFARERTQLIVSAWGLVKKQRNLR